MRLCTKTPFLAALLLGAMIGLPHLTRAQEAEEPKPVETPEPAEEPDAGADQAPTDAGTDVDADVSAEPKKKPRTPTAGGLPTEDPTIAPAKDPEEALEEEPSGEPDAGPEAEPPPTDTVRAAGPVEDPTLQEPPEEVPPVEEEPPVEEPVEEEKPEPPEDKGPNVQVVYDDMLLVGIDDWFYLALAGLVQARYTVNYRTDPPTDPVTLEQDKEVTQGFELPRARFTLGIGLTEFVAIVMRIGVVQGGAFEFQRAFLDLKWKYFRVRAGLFMNELIAESLIRPTNLLFADYSILENVYSSGSSKGVMFTYLRKRFSLNLGYSDGLRTGFSEIRSASNADFAVTLRAQYAWGDKGLGGFNRLASRRGNPLGIRLGGAVHYQDGGRTQGSVAAKIGIMTIDLSLRGSGWSILLATAFGQDATDKTETSEAGEIVTGSTSVMGGYFVLENLQVFGQYGFVSKPRIQGTLPPDFPPEILAEPSAFHSIGAGLAYFVIPGYDNVKLMTDFQYFIGSEAGSPVPASPLNSIQPNDAGSQFALRFQISAAF